MTDAHVSSQPGSKLLSAPPEIRQAIYAHIIHGQTHAFLSQGRIHFSVCLQPSLGDDHYDGFERRTVPDGSPDPTWARRLRSSWGPHWECEEVAYAENTNVNQHEHKHCRHHIFNLLSVCKKMFVDVCNFVAESTAINVTDLDTLDALLPKPDELGSVPNLPWNFWDCIRPSIHNLNVTFRLPLAFYRALEEDEDLVSIAGHYTSAVSTKCTMWERLWPAVCQLQQLRSLHIWLDHDDSSSWSVVKERLALRRVIATLAAHMEARSKGNTPPNMDITFNLPKLHPRKARPDTHFVQGSPPPPFPIQRRIRQRYHCEEGAGGNLTARYEADFPLMHQLPGVYEIPDMTLEDVERVETMLWNEGNEVYEIIGCVPHDAYM